MRREESRQPEDFYHPEEVGIANEGIKEFGKEKAKWPNNALQPTRLTLGNFSDSVFCDLDSELRVADLKRSAKMKLPKPTERLADCVWLPRIVAKARLLVAGALSEEYAQRFCHPSGVDGQFLRFFDLTKEDIVLQSDRSDQEIMEWFQAAPARKANIREWNRVAVNLWHAGFPMVDRLPIALSTTYKHLVDRNPETVFEALEADEKEG